MKFLLTAVNAKYIHSNPAVYSLAAFAGLRCSSELSVAEYTINETPDEILDGIYHAHPDWIGISCYIWNTETVQHLLPELAKILPGVPVWLGGPEVSFCPEEVLRAFPGVTGIMVGEGELSFAALVRFYESGAGSLSSIPGLVFRSPSGNHADEAAASADKTAFVRTPGAPLTGLGAVPFLYGEPDRFRNRILYYESSRGCPFRCAYCLSSIEKSVRFRDPATVVRELQFLLDSRIRQVKFVDRTFNCSEAHALSIWRYLKEHDNGVTNFHFELEAELLTEAELMLLESLRPGYFQVEIGVQSTNPETLRAVNRRADFRRLTAAVTRLIRGGNIHVHLDLIAGLPFEDYGSFRKSFCDVYALRPHELQLGFLKVLKGTAIASSARDFGIVARSYPPYEVLSTKWLSYAELSRLKKIEAVFELYYGSGQYAHVLPVLETFFRDPLELYEELADFYERNRCFVVTPSRIRRYEVLLGFITEKTEPAALPLFRELLTFDVYLRENMKSRPDFASGLPRIKSKSIDVHEELFSYPVWRLPAQGARNAAGFSVLPERQRVRFAYGKRDPVTNSAGIELLPPSPDRAC